MRQVTGLLRSWGWRHWLAVCLGVCAILEGHAGVPLTWAQNTQLVDGIAAIVNDDIITITEVREAMLPETEQLSRQYSGLALDQQVKASFKRTLTGLVDVQLQLARARLLNLRVSEEDVHQQIDALKKQNDVADEQFLQLLKTRGLTLEAYKKQVAESLLITKVVNAEVRSRLTVLDTHILFLFPPYATEQDEQRLRAKAESVLQQLRNGGEFTALARQYSDGPSAETGGLLGTFKPGELLPGFEEAAAQLRPGQISDVVRTRIGFHIIRLEARQAASMRPFTEVQEDLKSEILRDKTERRYQEWLESLRQQAYIKILYEG